MSAAETWGDSWLTAPEARAARAEEAERAVLARVLTGPTPIRPTIAPARRLRPGAYARRATRRRVYRRAREGAIITAGGAGIVALWWLASVLAWVLDAPGTP